MLSLVDLPEELLIMIIRQLDTKSTYNLYKTCQRMKNTISMHSVIRVCNLSLNTLATEKSLKLEMVKNISNHLYELNLCGVSDLTKSILLPAVKKMICLKTLNVAYTKINLIDLLDIYRSCPTIKNIAINFQFKNSNTVKLTSKILADCQEVFKNFINVHFILRSFTDLPLYIMKKALLNTLTYTYTSICDCEGVYYGDHIPVFPVLIDSMVPFNHFCIFMLNWELLNIYQGTLNILLPLVNLRLVEFIVIEYDTSYSICISPMFTRFFSENFHITSFRSLELQKPLKGNVAIFVWNKETTTFDDLFYCNLKRRIKAILGFEIVVESDKNLSLGAVTQTYDWFYFKLLKSDHDKNRREDYTGPDFKKMRMVQPSEVLNYDSTFKDCVNINLRLSFMNMYIVTLSANSEYLTKLTYLSLTGSTVRYSNEFFNVLFRCCEKLVTLNVEAPALSPCCSPVMRSIPLSQSIKNIRLADKRIDFNMLFSSFSQCTTLENICIVDISSEFNNLADPSTLFNKCSNLYSLYIHAAMSGRSNKKNLNMLNSCKSKCSKHYLNLSLHNSHDRVKSDYSPYVDIFKLTPIKPV